MRAVLNTLVDELTRLKASGVKTVSVSDESLAALKSALRRRFQNSPAPAQPAAGLPQHSAKDNPPIAAILGTPTTPPIASPGERRQSVEPKKTEARKLPPPAPFALPAGDKAARWNWLLERVLNDPVCKANVRPGKKAVLGVGSLEAKIMFVGEAPGAEEEIQGEPFVGPAGQLLTRMIVATGLKREEVYIGNIMNWRPQLPLGADGQQYGNREPTEEEMTYCLPFLRAQIEIVQPAVIVAMGATASKGLLGFRSFKTLGEIRGRWHDYLGTPLRVTYHPSYLLRKESESKLSEKKAKRAAWEDFLVIMEKAGMPISEKQRGYFL
ncbi:MAG: uracil-DNA glycosylase [Opitutaceae bacterium]|jgi:DNA polymerase